MRAFRVADRRFPLFDGTGARIVGGRWNSPGRPLIYAAESFAGALLEVLVHSNLGRAPRTHAAIEITIPETIPIESARGADLAGWDAEEQRVSRDFGNRWLKEQRSCVLLVPSLVTRGREHNVLINPDHGDFGQIVASAPEDLQWDKRLFRNARKTGHGFAPDVPPPE
jgi:RES domain-containing protein